MRYLEGADLEKAKMWMLFAGKVAEMALCLKAKCGAIVVAEGRVIGKGYNAPPEDDVSKRRCNDEYDLPPNNKHDRTCCMHAEWRAIMDALRRGPRFVEGSTLYFTRVDGDGRLIKSGTPYCTECSRAALDIGIAYFVLYHEEGMAKYPTSEYNDISYQPKGA